MKVIILIVALLVCSIAAKQFNLACTAECTAYYVCYARAAFEQKQSNCAYPQGCECKKFAWQEQADQALGSLAAVLKSRQVLKPFDVEAHPRSEDNHEAADINLASAISKISVSCTAKCAEYWVCKAKGAWEGDYSSCKTPAGCDCTKFAWENNKSMSDAELLNKLKQWWEKKGKYLFNYEKQSDDEVEADQVLDRIRSWFNDKIQGLKRLLTKQRKQVQKATVLSDLTIARAPRCFCIRAPCNCTKYFVESEQFLDNFKKWFEGKLVDLKNKLSGTENKTKSDLSLPNRKPTCMCIRAPCDCDKWAKRQDNIFKRMFGEVKKSRKIPVKRIADALKPKDKKELKRIFDKLFKKQQE